MHPPQLGDSWLELTAQNIPVGELYQWCVSPGCGAVVLFSGTVRDHSVDGEVRRSGVQSLTYEAYDSQVTAVLARIAAEARTRWPQIGRLAIVHRTGEVALADSSVVVAVGAPHRPEAFEAARFLIDAVKASAPIWKHETWDGGEGWGTSSRQPIEPGQVSRG